MTGRPPKPVLVKQQDGDTRHIGANKHAEACAGAHEARRGRPQMPADLDPIAREHWEYLADGLAAEGLLAMVDEGMLTLAAQLYSGIRKANKGRKPNFRALSDLAARYMQLADRMGLNESARAKIPRKPQATNPLDDAMCG